MTTILVKIDYFLTYPNRSRQAAVPRRPLVLVRNPPLPHRHQELTSGRRGETPASGSRPFVESQESPLTPEEQMVQLAKMENFQRIIRVQIKPHSTLDSLNKTEIHIRGGDVARPQSR